jgi:hypothetical protein
MTLLCATTPLWGALATARDIERGWVGYCLALSVGVLVGGPCSWAMLALGNIIGIKARAGWYIRRQWRLRAIYLVGAVLIIVAGVAGTWMTSALAHHI